MLPRPVLRLGAADDAIRAVDGVLVGAGEQRSASAPRPPADTTARAFAGEPLAGYALGRIEEDHPHGVLADTVVGDRRRETALVGDDRVRERVVPKVGATAGSRREPDRDGEDNQKRRRRPPLPRHRLTLHDCSAQRTAHNLRAPRPRLAATLW